MAQIHSENNERKQQFWKTWMKLKELDFVMKITNVFGEMNDVKWR
jgi:hypothetical protein